MTTGLALSGSDSAQPHSGTIRVAVVDDHELLLVGIAAWLAAAGDDIEVVAAVTSWSKLLAHPAHPADVVLLDLDLGDQSPVSVKIAALTASGCHVVVVSQFATAQHVRDAMRAGALGYVPKTEPTEVLVEAIRSAAEGAMMISQDLAHLMLTDPQLSRPGLSVQEQRVLRLYASGLPMKSVARRMGVKTDTARSYLTRVREKYAAAGKESRSKLDLHRRAVEDGWLDDGIGRPGDPFTPFTASA